MHWFIWFHSKRIASQLSASCQQTELRHNQLRTQDMKSTTSPPLFLYLLFKIAVKMKMKMIWSEIEN